MNKKLIQFIEFCLIDGVLSDKEKEVIFRKSRELGIPDDECEILIDGMIFKHSKASLQSNNSKTNEEEYSDKINVEKPQTTETSEDTLKEIFESTYQIRIQELQKQNGNINSEIQDLDKKAEMLDQLISNLNQQSKKLLLENRKINTQLKSYNKLYHDKLESFINNSKQKITTLNFELHPQNPKFYTINKNFFGNKTKGSKTSTTWVEFFEKNDFEEKYYLNTEDIKVINEIKSIYENTRIIIVNKNMKFKNAINENFRKKLKINSDINDLVNEKNTIFKLRNKKIESSNKIKTEIESIKKIISDENFVKFKKLYLKAPVLYQAKIFGKYLEIIQVENIQEIENLTRFLKFIESSEKEYTERIKMNFKRLINGNLPNDEITILFDKKKILISLYNSFHIMYQSLVEKKFGLYMKVYVEIESAGMFENYYQKDVLNKLNNLNKNLQIINKAVNVVSEEIHRTNDYLNLLNTSIYDIKLSVDRTSLTLEDISNSIEEGNMMLENGNDLLNGIKAGIGLNNILSGIQTYQLYKINKNTKSLN